MRYTALAFFVIWVTPVSAGALLDTARADNNCQVSRILNTDVDVRERGPHGETALHWMAFHGNQATVRRLIEAGASINDRLDKGSTPLHLAAYNGHPGVVRLLIDKGARVNVRTRTGITPLDWAKRNGYTEVAELLIAHGSKSGQTTAGGDIASQQGGYEQEIFAAQVAAAPMERIRRDTGEKGVYSAIARHRPSAGQSPAGRVGSRKLSLKDLRYEPDQEWVSKKHLYPQTTEDKPTSDDLKNKQRQPNHLPQATSYRIQLAAVSSKQRATRARKLYRREHGDILADLDPIIDKVSLKEKPFIGYRWDCSLGTMRDRCVNN